MRTLKHCSKEFGFLIEVLFPLLIILIGCTKEEIEPTGFGDYKTEMNLKGTIIHESIIHMKGFTRFGFYAVKEHRVLSDPGINLLECTAEMIFSEKQNVVLHTKEFFPGNLLYREVSFKGKMTPGGQLKLSWPSTFTELNMETNEYMEVLVGPLPEIKLHTGCNLFGPGINKNTLNYMGYFRQNKLFAETHFIGLQKVPGILPFLMEVIDGPIRINFMIDLEVSD